MCLTPWTSLSVIQLWDPINNFKTYREKRNMLNIIMNIQSSNSRLWENTMGQVIQVLENIKFKEKKGTEGELVD